MKRERRTNELLCTLELLATEVDVVSKLLLLCDHGRELVLERLQLVDQRFELRLLLRQVGHLHRELRLSLLELLLFGRDVLKIEQMLSLTEREERDKRKTKRNRR